MKKSLGYSATRTDGLWHGFYQLENTLEAKNLEPALVVLLEDENGEYTSCWDIAAQRFVFLDSNMDLLRYVVEKAYGDAATDDQRIRLVRVRVIIVPV